MTDRKYIEHLLDIAEHMRVLVPRHDWRGVDAVWPLVERIKEDGAVVIIKIDGERTGEYDNGQYTALISGHHLGDDAIRTDAKTVEEALSYAVSHYASRFWGIALPLVADID